MNIASATWLSACFAVTATFARLYSSAALPPLLMRDSGFFWSVAWWGRREPHRVRASSSLGPLYRNQEA